MNWDEIDQDDIEELVPAVKRSPQGFDYHVTAQLLSPNEEITLALKAQGGCERSRNAMVEANVRLVISIARRYTCRSMVMEDLIQEGVLGLVEAVQKFDTTLGYKFSTYATYWIRQAIIRAIEKQDRMIRLPAYGCNAERKVNQARRLLSETLGREPNVDEIAQHTGLSRRLIESLQPLGPEPMSLSLILSEDGDFTLQDLVMDQEAVEPEDASMQQFDRERLLQTLDLLKEREREVIKKRFAIGYDRVYSLREIADELNMSREGVRHMQNRTLKRLKRLLRVESGYTQGDQG